MPVLAALVCFAQVVGFGFLHIGDHQSILGNAALAAKPARELTLSDEAFVPGFPSPSPTAGLLLHVERLFAGDDLARSPAPFHAGGLLLHLAAVALLSSLALRLGAGPLGAMLAGGVLALHPAVAEPVAWATAQPYLLAAVLTLAALHAALAGKDELALLLAALAGLTHPSAALAPVLLVALDRLRGGDAAATSQRIPARLAASALLLFIALGPWRQGAGGAIAVTSDGSLGHHLRTAALVLGVRVADVLWPPSLATLPLRPAGDAAAATAVLGLGTTALVLAILITARRRPALAPFGLLLAATATAPTLGLIAIEHPFRAAHLYLPIAGLALAAGAIIARAPARAGVAAAALTLLFAVGAARQAAAYASSDDLIAGSHRVTVGEPDWYVERARAARSTGDLQRAMGILLDLERERPDDHSHLKLKGDILRAAGRTRVAWWAYVFAVRSGDLSACGPLLAIADAEHYAAEPGSRAELNRCLAPP